MPMPTKPKKVKDVDDVKDIDEFGRFVGDDATALAAIEQHLKPLHSEKEKSGFAPAATSLQQSFTLLHSTSVHQDSSCTTSNPPLPCLERPERLERPECPEGGVPWDDIERAIEATALSKPKSSDNPIRELGRRRLRGVEGVLRMKFTPKTLQQIYLKWEMRNKKYLTPGEGLFPRASPKVWNGSRPLRGDFARRAGSGVARDTTHRRDTAA